MAENISHETIVKDIKALPVMLPGKLVGRDAVLQQVYNELKENNAILLYGQAGVGKTGLVAALANLYTQQPGGVLWMTVNMPRLEELIVRVGRAYGLDEVVNSDAPINLMGAVESALQRNRPLVVIDGKIQADIASRFVTRCAEEVPVVIINPDALEGPWTPIEITKLSADDAAALFKREARLTTSEHDMNVFGILKYIETTPLAVITAARAMVVAKQTPDVFITTLKQMAGANGANINNAFNASFRALNSALQGVALMLGAVFSGGASAEFMSQLTGAQTDSIQQAMTVLAQLNMVEKTERYGAPYYHLHTLIQDFTQARLGDKIDALHQKARDLIVAYVQKYATESPTSYDKLATEMENILAVARWAADNGDLKIANDLATSLLQAGSFVRERGYLYEVLQLRSIGTGFSKPFPAYQPEPPITFDDVDEEDEEEEYDLEEEEAFDFDLDEEEDEDEIATPSFLSSFGDDDDFPAPQPMPTTPYSFDLSSKDLGKLRTMLAQVKQSGDSEKQLEVLKAIGAVQIEQGMQNEAIATYGEMLSVYETVDDKQGLLSTLDMTASLMVKTENLQAAVMHASRGVRLAEEIRESELQMKLLITLADAHQQLGESSVSIKEYTRALETARLLGDKQHEALILYKMAYAQLDDSDTQTAIDNWEDALKLFRSQNRRDYEGRTLGALGSAYGDLRRWAEAVNFHTSALYVARETKDKDEEALQLTSLAYAANQAGQMGEALLRYRQALHLAYVADNADNIVSLVVEMSRLLLNSRSYVNIAELVVNDALKYDPNDRDLKQLKERIITEKQLASELGSKLKPVNGSAEQYAQNAYQLLEN
ncbi:MAG: tetratricopeptide repeat protein [bacterium]|nr:tetratricopeptide repeat protein [bacterium]